MIKPPISHQLVCGGAAVSGMGVGSGVTAGSGAGSGMVIVTIAVSGEARGVWLLFTSWTPRVCRPGSRSSQVAEVSVVAR